MKQLLAAVASMLLASSAVAQVRVNPTGVNVNSQGATTAFLTFGGLRNQAPAEALWCGDLVPAAPDLGLKCNPLTIFGSLPARLDRSTTSGTGGFTDIMSIPPSVARRAYQAAEAGETSSFFYVRRFASLTGGPSEFVAVTCRMAGGGARVPLSLVDVSIAFPGDSPVIYVEPGAPLPPIKARISYNGTGRLVGRWEVVLPGDEPPTSDDLLTEATLPVERRPLQRRYAAIERFNVFLAPTGRYTLEGPAPGRLPTLVNGTYLVLLRIEASDDKEADSDLISAGAGAGVVHAGAVAGFPMPPLRYVVAGASEGEAAAGGLELLAPVAGFSAGRNLEFAWRDARAASWYRLEIQNAGRQVIHEALLGPGVGVYRAPSWLKERAPDGALRWRVVALGAGGREARASGWRRLTLED